jgi:molybdopterin-containing oxidoreductase family iron-sulfur binding subunit
MPSLGRDRTYWRSLDELADSAEFRTFVEREFPTVKDDVVNGESRRTFLKLMGASMALAGLTACRWPKETIVPFAHRPAGFIPGELQFFATAIEMDGAAQGLLVTSYDGRPIKIEGNPSHPSSLGATSALAQASVLDLYDPDRSRAPVERAGTEEFNREWDEFAAVARGHFAALRTRGGQGLRFLCEASSSPSLAALRESLRQAMPRAGWHEWEPISRDNEREGARIAFGRPLRAQLSFARADVVVALDADVLHDHPASVRLAREHADRRRGDDRTMNRLWSIESTLSPTGAVADHRYAVAPQLLPVVALRLAGELQGRGVALPAGVAEAASRAASNAYQPTFAAALAEDLAAHRGRSLIVAGAGLPAEVHALVAALNVALGNAGQTVVYTAEPDENRPAHAASLAALVDDMRSGAVDTLVILGSNPVYAAPVDLAFADALGRVKTSIHLGLHRDETGRACTWHVPRAHFLEAWGDVRAWDGTISIVQPLIEPLFGGRTPAEIVALAVGGGPVAGYEITRSTFFAGATPDKAGETAWRAALNEGFLAGTAFPPVEAALDSGIGGRLAAVALPSTVPSERNLGLVLKAAFGVHDGRFANNAWLQETPDPISKITWDNPLLIGPATAEKLGIKDEDLVRVSAGGRQIDAAACVTPGIAPFTVVIALGYGRTAAGKVGNGVGFNSYALRDGKALYSRDGVTVERTGRRYQLASTQNHWAIEKLGRREAEHRSYELVREATLEEYRKKPDFAREGQEEAFSLWTEFKYEGHAWAMAIDLSACTGCSACAVACQAENNIPVVGKEQVARGREMNWIRIDRYYRGDPENPTVVFQPMACVHCENAPCEQVCPVGATVHSHEGLNQMVYNRCVGTRYCSNNCPYKVRRFNYFNWNYKLNELQKMQKNPEVTVRTRGVMEKCTYCVQRIERVKIRAKNDKRPIKDGEIVTACAQACPARAIVFGDLNDPESRVRKLHEGHRSYGVLAEIHTKPRTQYLARLRNPAAGAAQPHGEHA